ncbi:hypothetical protein EJ08DRAFT_709223 [Tothia fuscella]|uniref:Uncharacterized protein n=1 Tax=Tothia fuscella TaxID=1048955 RepID=A0A9P4NDY6_9PEZI|nr:hypothetical protein EJ08DRAFT_709223 [Tothia fuscella]
MLQGLQDHSEDWLENSPTVEIRILRAARDLLRRQQLRRRKPFDLEIDDNNSGQKEPQNEIADVDLAYSSSTTENSPVHDEEAALPTNFEEAKPASANEEDPSSANDHSSVFETTAAIPSPSVWVSKRVRAKLAQNTANPPDLKVTESSTPIVFHGTGAVGHTNKANPNRTVGVYRRDRRHAYVPAPSHGINTNNTASSTPGGATLAPPIPSNIPLATHCNPMVRFPLGTILCTIWVEPWLPDRHTGSRHATKWTFATPWGDLHAKCRYQIVYCDLPASYIMKTWPMTSHEFGTPWNGRVSIPSCGDGSSGGRPDERDTVSSCGNGR